MLRLSVVEHQPWHQRRKYLGGKGDLKHGLIVRAYFHVMPAAQRHGKTLVHPAPQPLGLRPRRCRIVIDMGVVAGDFAKGSGGSRGETMRRVRHLDFPQIAPISARHCCVSFMRSAIWRGSLQSRLSANTVCAAALLGPAHHPAQRRLADLGAQQAGLGADDGVADFRHRQNVAHQILAALRDRQHAAPQAVDEIDLLDRIDAQIAGQPELVDAAADVAVAIFKQVDDISASAPRRCAARSPDRPARRMPRSPSAGCGRDSTPRCF